MLDSMKKPGFRLVFLGNDEWSVPSLDALAASEHTVEMAVTRTPRPARRGQGLVPTPVAAAARRLGLDVAEVETVRSGPGFDRLAEARPEVLVVVAYGEILSGAVLTIPSAAAVNVHFSLLPELRGAGPVQWALLRGMTTTGVSTMLMDEGMDTGPILLQAEESIDAEDDAGTLGGRLAAIGGRLLVDTIDGLAAGTLVPTPQDHEQATLAPKIRREDRTLRFEEDAEALVRRVRAMGPEPGAATRFRGRALKVLRAEAEAAPIGDPGAIVAAGAGLVVATGHGGLRIREVVPESRSPMDAAAFVRGYGPKVGERLG
jgi:methionyl-tRNA formyltransferase